MVVISPYLEPFRIVSARRASDIVRTIQNNGGIIDGCGKRSKMGKNVLASLDRAGIHFIGQDQTEHDVVEAEREVQELHDKAVRYRALSGYQRQEMHLREPMTPVVFPNGNRVPELTGNEAEKREQASKFLDDVLGDGTKIRKMYGGRMFYIEALPENPKLKKAHIEFIAHALPKDAIIGTNTSSILIDELAENVPNPERVVGIHFFVPADRNPGLEIIKGSKTSNETVVAVYNLAIADRKKPIIAWKDGPGAVANRIYCGLLSYLGRMVESGVATSKFANREFRETFYSKQVNIHHSMAKKQFDEVIDLSFFEDEVGLYRQIARCDRQIGRLMRRRGGEEGIKKLETVLKEKRALVMEAFGKLNQKDLYSQIAQNIGAAGSFYAPPEAICKVQGDVKDQYSKLKQYLEPIEKAELAGHGEDEILRLYQRECPLMFPYDYPKPLDPLSSRDPQLAKQYISDRLKGAYIAIAYELYTQGFASVQDIEQACMDYFKFNIGPFHLAEELGREEVERLIALANEGLPTDKPTGISRPDFIEFRNNELSGVQTYVQNGIGYIVMGRNHIQTLINTQNSLNPEMIEGILVALDEFEKNGNVRAIALRSQGGGIFSSGADLEWIRDQVKARKLKTYGDSGLLKRLLIKLFNRARIRESEQRLAEDLDGFKHLGKKLMNRLHDKRKPKTIFAIVDGATTGGGVGLAAACDYVLVTDQASFAMPENGLGLYPAWEEVVTVPERIGIRAALPFICNSRGTKPGKFVWISADEACQLELADNKVPILQSELPHYIADLVEGKVEGINIFEKPKREPRFDKPISAYPAQTVKRFSIKDNRDGEPIYTHRWRLFTRGIARYTEGLIRHSAEPDYESKNTTTEDSEKVFRGARRVLGTYVEPQIWAAQSKGLINTVGALKAGAIYTGKGIGLGFKGLGLLLKSPYLIYKALR